MPKIDSKTGCVVSTYFEALANVGATSNPPKDAADIQQEINDMFDDDNQRIENEYRTNALQYLADAIAQQDDDVPTPTEVIEVIGTNSKSGMCSSDSGFTAKCKTQDGRELFYVFVEYWEADSMAGPGDCGAEVAVFEPTVVTDDEIKYFVENFNEYGRNYDKFCWSQDTRLKIADFVRRGLVSTAYGRIKLTELGRYSTGLTCDELFPENLRPRLRK